MAYRFKKDEAIPRAIERVFAEEISWAVGQLARSRKRAEAVHEARKGIKKIRALLSLFKNRLGPLYKTQDRYFRDAAQLLSGFRDEVVMVQVFDALAAKHPGMDAIAVKEIRHYLGQKERQTRSEKDVTSEVVRLLRQSQSQAQAWPLQDLQFESLLPILAAAYRAGRKALKHAQKQQTAGSRHNFRKKVKQHWYHLRLFENPRNAGLTKRLADLHELETCLGDEHNLAVLRERLEAEAETSRDRHQIRQVVDWLDEESEELQRRAHEMGQRLYSEKVSAFSERLAELRVPVRKPAVAASPLRARSAVA